MNQFKDTLTELFEARELIGKLLIELDEAKKVLQSHYKIVDRTYVTWEIYNKRSPEMQRINAAMIDAFNYLNKNLEQ